MVTKFNPFQGADEERKKRALQQALKGKAAGAMSSVASCLLYTSPSPRDPE